MVNYWPNVKYAEGDPDYGSFWVSTHFRSMYFVSCNYNLSVQIIDDVAYNHIADIRYKLLFFMNDFFLYCDMVVKNMSGQNTAPVQG